MRIGECAVLPAPRETVWRVLADWERQATWMPDVAWVRVVGPERELGARLAVRTKVFGVPATTDMLTVVAWEPPARLAIEHQGVVKGAGAWRLEPAVGGMRTRFTWSESLRMPPRMLGELALRAYAPWQRWMLRRSVANLSAIVTAG
jgi:carbon monoxide dehydrogenase subunit G